ncbi:MAG: cytochrome P450 [Roseiarcus sp.]
MQEIPQPKPTWLLGNVPDLDRHGVVQSLVKLGHEHGPIFRLKLPQEDCIVVGSQKLIDEICDETRFDKKVHRALEELRFFIGDSLFTARTDEPNWPIAHRILMPAFGMAALRTMFDGIMDIAQQMLLKWERQGGEQDINVTDNMTRLTLDSIALCGFHYRFNSFYQNEMHPFVNAMVRALAEAIARIQRLPIQTRLMLLSQHQFAEDARVQHQLADQLIAERRMHGDRREKDLLGIMLSAKDPQTGAQLSDANIRYQIVTLLAAGHETTSGLLSFALYFLLENKDVLERVRAEADRVFGGDAPRFEHVAQLVYTDQVLKETLRIWPTAPVFAVYPRNEETILGGVYRVRHDEVIYALLPLLHRDPAVWGPDADQFKPERFAPEAFGRLPPNAWKPFGNGQRACIGRPFAMMEATLALAMIVRRFDIAKADPGYQLRVKETLSLKPDGFFIRAKRREIAIPEQTAAPTAARPPAAADADGGSSAPNGIPIRVLFGSNAGSAESFAHSIASEARLHGYVASVDPLDSAVDRLAGDGAVVIVTASYEGHPPDNAKRFVAWIEGLPAQSLAGMKYAVFGCGNRDWAATYQAIPKTIDSRLRKLGAQCIMERGEADARGDFFGDFDRWRGAFETKLDQAFGLEAAKPAPFPRLSVEFVPSVRDALTRQNDLEMGEIVENRELVDMASPNARSKRHIEVALPQGARYRAGDYLVVLPTNFPDNVERALRRFGLSYDAQLEIRANRGATTHLPTDRPIAVGEILSSYVELCVPATRKQIEELAASTPCPPERAALESLIAGDNVFNTEILQKRTSVLVLLERFASCALPFASFLQMLPPLKPRQYSISSSPAWSAEHCTITVAVVCAPALGGNGVYHGCASSYLAQARPGAKVAVSVRPSNAAFHVPEQLDVPMIMVGSGSGVAPFRGFLQERALRAASEGARCGEAVLFFGCDAPDVDYLYKDQFAEWERQGLVRVHPAFASVGEGGVRYVQDRLWNDRDEVTRLMEKGARIYVCGDGRRMAPAVRDALCRIHREASRCSDEEMTAWLAELEKSVRYVQDVYA